MQIHYRTTNLYTSIHETYNMYIIFTLYNKTTQSNYFLVLITGSILLGDPSMGFNNNPGD